MAGVLLILFLLFLVTPIVELYLIIKVADATGLLNTVALLILVSVVGAWLVRREGLGILRRAQRELNEAGFRAVSWSTASWSSSPAP